MSEKFVSPCELPTAYEREILTILIEECSEVQQRATKLLRFGRDEIQPGQTLTNSDRLSLELGDLACMVEMAERLGLVDSVRIRSGAVNKHDKLTKYLQSKPVN